MWYGRGIRLVSALAFAVANSVGPAVAQDTLTVVDEVSCKTCDISIEEIGGFGGPADTLGFGPMDGPTLAFASAERIWISPGLMQPSLAIYAADGELQRVIQAEGEGPREWSRIERIGGGTAGQVVVAGGGRLGWYTSEGEMLDQVRLPGRALQVYGSGDHEAVVLGFLESSNPDASIHIVDGDGTIRASFGPERSDGIPFPQLSVSPRAGGGVWSLSHATYEIIGWSEDGERQVVLTRDSDWFEPWNEWDALYDGIPPTRALWIQEDERGRLWVTSWIADEEFQVVSGPPSGLLGGVDDAETYDSVTEIIDPRTGEILMRLEQDRPIWGPIHGRRAFRRHQDDLGFYVFTLLELGMVGGP